MTEDAVRRNVARVERALLVMVPPSLRARGVAFSCVHRAATSERPPRYRVIATWVDDTSRPGRPANHGRTSIHFGSPDVVRLLADLPGFLKFLPTPPEEG